MNSSAKYQQFRQEEPKRQNRHASDEPDGDAKDSVHIKRNNNGRCLLIGLVTTIIVLVAVFFIAAFAIGVGVGVGVSQKNEAQTGVTVIAISPAELEGEYYSPEGAGSIRFHSSVNDTHFVLSIFTTNGELLVTITHPLVLNMTLMGINSTNFLVMKNVPGRPKYVVPDQMMNVMESVMSGDRNMTDEILQELDTKSVNETSHNVLFIFTTSPEAKLIIEAALALGEQGYQGRDYTPLMQFYQLALRLVKIRLNASIDDGGNTIQKRSTRKTSHTRPKRFFNFLSRFVCSDRSQRGCIDLPYTSPYDSSDRCFGLCGYGCCCWEFVCGDCCRHRYCETHDACCAEMGFFTLDCFQVGIDVLFSECSQDYDQCS